ncbi:Nickel uptake substrate-specific transmembrane region [Enhygromyxa salina]|uniref:Nickel uptake substrate-specific transmembrane region n=2 Tax=Enhygromyxa salina TaxID=215803 RepID=A0A2S9Y5U2_9BACT|nr:Nickel uptake substrate-specific transmembrane region [Enhygromyxa salina]
MLLSCPVTAHAHDYWLAPRDYTPAIDEPVTIDLFVGDHLVPEASRPHDPAKVHGFELRHRCAHEDLTRSSAAGADPVVDGRTFERDGLGLFGLEREWVDITLSDEKFTFYLEHEELTDMQAVRGQQAPRVEEHERYTRSIKSLIRVGERSRGRLHRKPLGHRMEIVLLDDPYRMQPGEPLRAKVLFAGKPLAGVAVSALHSRVNGVVTARGTTDAGGVVAFMIDQPGAWLLRLVYMQPCAGRRDEDACATADWRSYWASFSFAVGARG